MSEQPVFIVEPDDVTATTQHSVLEPRGSAYVDRGIYRSVHFYGPRLSDPLAEAAQYLRELEDRTDRPLPILCTRSEFSWADEETELAWRVTIVFGEPMILNH